MREGSSIQLSTTDPPDGLRPKPKSLFQNILAVSPFDARIYTHALRSKPGKSLRMNSLRTDMKKNVCLDRRWEEPLSSARPSSSPIEFLRDESLYPVILITAFFHPKKYSDLACGCSFIGLAERGRHDGCRHYSEHGPHGS